MQCELPRNEFAALGVSYCYQRVGLGETCGQDIFKNCPTTIWDDRTNVECVDNVCVKFDKAGMGERCGQDSRGEFPNRDCVEGLSCETQFGFQECVSFNLDVGAECNPNSPLVRDPLPGVRNTVSDFCKKGLTCVPVLCVGLEGFPIWDGCRGQHGICTAGQ